MTLVRAAADDWTSTGVKSTFAVDISWDSGVPEDVYSIMCTEPCGWGWRFLCRMDGAEWSPSSSGSLEKRAATITVSFDSYFVRGASYGRITFRTELENALPLPNELFYTEFSLPAHHAEILPISVFKCHRHDNLIPTISIAVELAPGLGVTLPRPLDARVEAALADTIRGVEIVDVKFYAYTRAGTSHVAHPRALCAKMDLLLGHSDLLDNYLEGISKEGFTESYLVDLDAHVLANSEERFGEYDYMSDSDLDTDDEDQKSDPAPFKPPVASTSALAVARRMGRVVVVKGHAYKTWNALLHYLYTGKIVFRAPKSAGVAASSSSPKIPQCSAKSMYKLADAFGLTELKGLALASLKSLLTAENILDEAFSRFTSWYGEVQDIEIPILLQHLPTLTSEMKRILRSVCNGNRPYSLDVLQKVVCSVPAANSQGPNEGPVPFSPRRLHRRPPSPPSPTRPMYHPPPVPHYSPPRPVPMVYPGSPPRPPSRYRFSVSPPPIPSPPRPAVVYATPSPRPLSGPRVLASPPLLMPSARRHPPPPPSPPSPMLYPQAMAHYSPPRSMYSRSPPRHPPPPPSPPSPMLYPQAMAHYSAPLPEAVMYSGSPSHSSSTPRYLASPPPMSSPPRPSAAMYSQSPHRRSPSPPSHPRPTTYSPQPTFYRLVVQGRAPVVRSISPPSVSPPIRSQSPSLVVHTDAPPDINSLPAPTQDSPNMPMMANEYYGFGSPQLVTEAIVPEVAPSPDAAPEMLVMASESPQPLISPSPSPPAQDRRWGWA